MSGGRKLPCGRPVSGVCPPKTSSMNNFPQTHLKANNHIAPYCNRKTILPLRNPCKSIKVLALRAETLHPKIRLLSLRTMDSRRPQFNPIWGNADCALESPPALVYDPHVQRGEEIRQPKTTPPFGSRTSLHPSRQVLFPWHSTPTNPTAPPRPSRSPTLLSPLPGVPGRPTAPAPPGSVYSRPGGKPAVESSAVGRGDARRRSGRQVGPRRRPAPHLMQSAFRKRARPPRSPRKRFCALPWPLRPPPGFRATSLPDFAGNGGRHSAYPRGPARVGKSPPAKAKLLAALIVTWNRPLNVLWLLEEIPLIMYFQRRPAEAGKAFNLLCWDPSFRPPPITHLPPSLKGTFIVTVLRQCGQDSLLPSSSS